MDHVETIFSAFGKVKTFAEAVELSPQTVCDWRKKGKRNIPVWRRAAVLAAIDRGGINIPRETRDWLQSQTPAEHA